MKYTVTFLRQESQTGLHTISNDSELFDLLHSIFDMAHVINRTAQIIKRSEKMTRFLSSDYKCKLGLELSSFLM